MLKEINAVQLADGVYWLGILQDKRLEINTYLRIFKGKDKTVNMVIDPGPPVVFDKLRDNLSALRKDPKNVHFIFLNHQDPDVSTNSMYFKKYNPNVKVICSEDTWRLVNFLGLNVTNFIDIDKFKSLRGRLSTGHTIRFIPTPFCHFRGAVMLFDEESRILFTGDLFGGITHSDGLYATSVNWHGIRTFHQLYMPDQEALQNALDQIKNLDPKPEIIAPQHGALIKGDLIDELIEKLYDLPVGWSLLKSLVKNKDFYIEAVNEIIDDIRKRAGDDMIEMALRKIESDGSFPNIFEFKNDKVIDIKLDPGKSMKMLIDALQEDQPKETMEIIRNAVLKAAVEWNLPLFESLINENTTPSELLVIENEDSY